MKVDEEKKIIRLQGRWQTSFSYWAKAQGRKKKKEGKKKNVPWKPDDDIGLTLEFLLYELQTLSAGAEITLGNFVGTGTEPLWRNRPQPRSYRILTRKKISLKEGEYMIQND